MADPQTEHHSPLDEVKQTLRELREQTTASKTPVFIAFLAAFLALVSMADEEATKNAMEAQIEAANQFAYFQAKNIRATSAEIAADTFNQQGNTRLADKWQKTADRYEGEKKEILAAARNEQAKRSIALARGDNYGVAVALLQIAIVLASISLITSGSFLLVISCILSFIASLFVINGYGLYYNIPADPALWIEGVKAYMAKTGS